MRHSLVWVGGGGWLELEGVCGALGGQRWVPSTPGRGSPPSVFSAICTSLLPPLPKSVPPCRYFLQFITQSRNTRNRLDAAKELKKLVRTWLGRASDMHAWLSEAGWGGRVGGRACMAGMS